MNYFILQSLLLLAVAYVLGALAGCWLRRLLRVAPGAMMDNAGLAGAAVGAATAADAAVAAKKLAPASEREASIEIARHEMHLPGSALREPDRSAAVAGATTRRDVPASTFGYREDDDIDLYMPQAHPATPGLEPHIPTSGLPDITFPASGLPDSAVTTIDLPHIDLPVIGLPEVELPQIDLAIPQIAVDDLPVIDGHAVSATDIHAAGDEGRGTAAGENAADDLTRIVGIGGPTALVLNRLGITRFDQIAAWRDIDIAWVSAQLGFSGRIERENWMDQARILASGNDLAFTSHQIDEMEDRDVAAHSSPSASGGVQQGDAAAIKAALAAAIGLSATGMAANANTALAGGISHATSAAPTGLAAAVVGDDLKLIKGIGTNIEAELNRLGYTRFAQIAAWTPRDVVAIGARLGLSGRIEREKWVHQARLLANGIGLG